MKQKYFVASLFSFFIATIFVIFGDGTSGGAAESGVRFIVLEYFHVATWLLLAGFFYLKTTKFKYVNYIGYIALVLYLVYLAIHFTN